jgi:DNA-binding MarR family transcriptional regulator
MGKKRNNNFKFHLPTGVAESIWDYCQDNALFKKPEVDYFKYIFIVHTITTHFNTHHLSHIATRGRDDEQYGGCPLNVKRLASKLGVNNGTASDLLKALIGMGIIKRRGGYTVGRKSYCYLLSNSSDEFTSITALTKYSANAEKIITKRNTGNDDSYAIRIYRKELQNISISIPPEHEYFQYVEATKGESKHLYPSCVSSMYPIYSSPSLSSPYSLATYYSPMVVENEQQALKLATTNDSVILENDKYESSILDYVSLQKTNLNIISLQAIIDGDWFVHRPDVLSRVHTNLTNLKREFRELLRYDNKPFIELDIRNSQPLIASIIIREYWTRKSKTIPPDIIIYQQDCEAGIFYDYFMELNNVAPDRRQEFKIQMFGEVFFSKVTKRNTKIKKQFIAKYPNVYTAICDIKGGMGSGTYNQFAILLQQKEASIIFDRVNIGLLKDCIPAFNIFDSILCLPEHKEIVRERLTNAFSAFNIIPTINYKTYNEKQNK